MSRHYQDAARVLQGVLKKQSSLKTLALEKDVKNKRFVMALVSETLKYKKILDTVLHRSGLNEKLRAEVRDPYLLYLLLYDLLFGKGIQGGGQIKRLLQSHQATLKAATKGLDQPAEGRKRGSKEGDGAATIAEEGAGGDEEATFPRYARVNTLKMKKAAVIAKLLAPSSSTNDDSEGEIAAVIKSSAEIQEDPHIPDLLILPPETDLHDHELVRTGALVLQDKASCFPAEILVGPTSQYKGGDVIDACAAPGNKTSHIAALLKQNFSKERVFALDRDVSRLTILKNRVLDTMGAKSVVPLLQDFLALDPRNPKMKDVRAILLDPSCSGSGMVASIERRYEGAVGKRTAAGGFSASKRLLALSQFQYKALVKAFSFPQVNRLTYSTCSIHAEEDEMVVSAALQAEAKKVADNTKYRPFELKPALKSWRRRGLVQTAEGRETGLSEEQAACLVRTDPKEDATNGFFVAYFERVGSSGQNGGKGQAKKRKEQPQKPPQQQQKSPQQQQQNGGSDSRKRKRPEEGEGTDGAASQDEEDGNGEQDQGENQRNDATDANRKSASQKRRERRKKNKTEAK